MLSPDNLCQDFELRVSGFGLPRNPAQCWMVHRLPVVQTTVDRLYAESKAGALQGLNHSSESRKLASDDRRTSSVFPPSSLFFSMRVLDGLYA